MLGPREGDKEIIKSHYEAPMSKKDTGGLKQIGPQKGVALLEEVWTFWRKCITLEVRFEVSHVFIIPPSVSVNYL